LFCKGSPEKLKDLCINVPNNFDSTLDQYSIKGFRVLGMGYKEVKKEDLKNLLRKDAEKDLIFLGLLVFYNPLKEDSCEVITNLIQNKLKCKIISGDNINTSIEVGRQV
jgi:P-type E1-E2 ATPase